MKQILVFLFLMLCSLASSGQSDLDFGFRTAYIHVYTQRIDSVATDSLKRIAKQGVKVENVVKKDTVHITQGGLRYLTKQGNSVIIYDPNYPKTQSRYTVEYAGWLTATVPIVKYNMINAQGSIIGVLTVDLYRQEFLLNLPGQQVLYSSQ